jgi:hypothetical protein
LTRSPSSVVLQQLEDGLDDPIPYRLTSLSAAARNSSAR